MLSEVNLMEMPGIRTNDQVTGLLFSYHSLPDQVRIAKELQHAMCLKSLIDAFEDYDPGATFLTITMPCGNVTIYETIDDVPMEKVMCQCGDPKHVVLNVDYEEEEGG